MREDTLAAYARHTMIVGTIAFVIFSVSVALRRSAEEEGGPGERIQIIPNPVTTEPVIGPTPAVPPTPPSPVMTNHSTSSPEPTPPPAPRVEVKAGGSDSQGVIWASRDVDLRRPREEVDRVVQLLRDALFRLSRGGDDRGDALATMWSRDECLIGLKNLVKHEAGAARLVEKALAETDLEVARTMGEALSESEGKLPPDLYLDMRNPNPARQSMALLALRNEPDPSIVDTYQTVAMGLDPAPQRALAIDALGRSLARSEGRAMDGKDALTMEVLRRLAKEDQDPTLRLSALRALGRSGDSDALAEFVFARSQNDTDPAVRDGAATLAMELKRRGQRTVGPVHR